MREIDNNDELRLIQLDILSYIDRLCRLHNIKYSISGGTLIGAVRHQGFIPWDDDIDIMLTRDEYDRLIHLIQKEYKTNCRYRVLTHSIDKEFLYPFAKIVDEKTVIEESLSSRKNYGVFIDVFPIDYIIPKNRILIKKQRLLCKLLMIKRLGRSHNRAILKNIILFILKFLLLPLSVDWIIREIESTAIKSNKNKSNLMGCLVWGYGQKEIVPADIHNYHIDMLFEDRVYMSIRDYDKYLSCLYGDYMKLPPLEKQITHHDFKAYWQD